MRAGRMRARRVTIQVVRVAIPHLARTQVVCRRIG